MTTNVITCSVATSVVLIAGLTREGVAFRVRELGDDTMEITVTGY